MTFVATMPKVATKRLGQLRTFQRRYQRSPEPHDTILEQMDLSIQTQLDLRNFITPPYIFSELGFKWDMTKQEIDEKFPRSLNRQPGKLEEWLAEGAESVRQHEWSYRIGQANADLTYEGWYPFFATLTSSDYPHPYKSKRELFQSRELEIWRRKLLDISIKNAPIKISLTAGRKTPSNYMRYAMVLEHGASRQHDHCHALIWMKFIPDAWKSDPNFGRDTPTYSRCLHAETLWPWGFSTFDYFRFIGDPWSQLGFQLPTKITSLRSPYDAGMYLTKYLTKESKEWNHRMKATQNLGLTKIQNFLETMCNRTLEMMLKLPNSYALLRNVKEKLNVPLSLIRRLSKLETWERKWTSPQRIELSTLKIWDVFGTMQKNVDASHPPWRKSLPERYHWLKSCLPPGSVAHSDSDWLDCWSLCVVEFPDLGYKPLKPLKGEIHELF